jgi:hypothetical protein
LDLIFDLLLTFSTIPTTIPIRTAGYFALIQLQAVTCKTVVERCPPLYLPGNGGLLAAVVVMADSRDGFLISRHPVFQTRESGMYAGRD